VELLVAPHVQVTEPLDEPGEVLWGRAAEDLEPLLTFRPWQLEDRWKL